MAYLRLAAASAAVLLACGAALAQGAKLTDPQIAHIAYTAGLIDIQAAEQALQKEQEQGRHRLCAEHGARPQGRERPSVGAGQEAQMSRRKTTTPARH